MIRNCQPGRRGSPDGPAATGTKRCALTSEYKISYLRPALGERLVARARARHAGKRHAVCECEIHAVDGDWEKLCAIAQGTVVPAG